MYQIIQKYKIFLGLSLFFCLLSLLSLIFWGLRPGTDFTGGVLLEVEYQEKRPEIKELKEKLKNFNLEFQPSGKNGLILRTKEMEEKTHEEILKALGNVKEKRFEKIGPVIGKELTKKSRLAVFFALSGILIYLAFAFRKISKIIKPGESWRYSLGAILALVHDVLIMSGFFSVMGHFQGVEVDTLFIIAILTVLGYSVNDTIIVYDRIRENILTTKLKDFKEILNLSLNETLMRTLNTSLTTLLAILVIYLFGGEAIKNFALALMVGIISGTYSSISIAVPFLLFKREKTI